MGCQADHDPFHKTCEKVIKEHGGRFTGSRLAVARCLERATQPLTPREVFETVAADPKQKNLDRVSVYRVLEFLLELGLVHRVGPQGGFVACTHTQCPAGLHVLTRCTGCGATSEEAVPEQVIAPVQWYLTQQLNFRPSEHVFQISGVCSRCAKGGRASRKK